MEVQLSLDQSARLSRLAQTEGRAAEAHVQEAIKKLLGYDEWFLREVDHGIAEVDRGEFIEQDNVRRMIETRYPAR